MKKINAKKDAEAAAEAAQNAVAAAQASGKMTCAGHVLTDDELALGCSCKKPKKPMTCPKPSGGGPTQMDQPGVQDWLIFKRIT